jgi:acetate kinase
VRVLVFNAGSSSLKLRLVAADDGLLYQRDLSVTGGAFDATEVSDAVAGIATQVDAVGHRVVHGGMRFTAPVRIDGAVEADLRALTDLAPLHQPKSLAGIDAARAALPHVVAVACFDTAFHATMPAAAATYALPAEWRQQFGLRRYGFHGLSHAYASCRTAELLGTPIEELRIVTCHLGAGASLAAVREGRSVDTTMGFTPLEGLVMATRSGTVDPGALIWLLQHGSVTVDELAETLEHRSGLLALAGTAGMGDVLEAAGRGDAAAVLAVDVYVHRLRAGVASMASALGGLDAVAFTGGVGENAPAVRARVANDLGWLGMAVDADRNSTARSDADISASAAGVRTVVVSAREDLQIAREVRGLLGAG